MKINGRETKKNVYCWYDHLLLRGTGVDKHIEKAIKDHDWKQFKTYQYILNNIVTEDQGNEKWVYLPKSVHVQYVDDDDWDSVEMTEEIFKAIDLNEYECG